MWDLPKLLNTIVEQCSRAYSTYTTMQRLYISIVGIEVQMNQINQEFEMSNLNGKQKKIAEVFVKAAEKFSDNPSTGGCKPFYTPKEWKERGEDYGTESELVVVYDGGDLHDICNINAGFYTAHEYLTEQLSKKGYFFEECTGWYGAVYKD